MSKPILPAEVPGTLEALHDSIRAVLKTEATRKLFDALVARRGRAMSVADLAEATGIDAAGGYFRACIGPLGTLGLITRKGGVATPTEVMFPRGLT